MKLAIVILNWNGVPLLEKYLPLVLEHSKNAAVYVIDNASNDASVALLQNNFPSVRVIQNSKNFGFAGGYNEGLKTIQADLYCLLNSDVEVTPNWLDPILRYYDTNPNASIVQPKILDLKRRNYFEYAGAGGGFLDQVGYPFCRGRVFQTLEKDTGQYDDTREIFWATGACMFVKAALFWELGGFDAAYFAHQEEIDLCWRAKNKGHGVYYVGQSHVFHLGGSTLSNMNPKKTYLNFRNSLFSIVKNAPVRSVLVILPLRLVLDGIAGVRFLFQLKPSHCFAIIRSHFGFYARFFSMWKKRKQNTTQKKYYATTSVVWSYFVNTKRTFKDLVKD